MAIHRRLYLKITALVIFGLLFFALVASQLWNYIGNNDENVVLFQRTTSLTTLLLPDPGADEESHQLTAERISKSLEFEITIYGKDKILLAATHEPLPMPENVVAGPNWIPTDGMTQWYTTLPDGRTILIKLDRVYVLDDRSNLLIFLAVLAVLVALLLFPFIRNLTRRLEHLKESVELIGSGDLNARVDVIGSDEVASLAQSFNVAFEEIEELVTSQRLLLANASHEIRTPLARIRMGMDMLIKNPNQEKRDALQRDIVELDALIDEVILLTRLDNGLNEDAIETVDLFAVAAEELAYYPSAELTGNSVFVAGDPRMLQHVVRNLLDNAFKYGAEPISIHVSTNALKAEISVSDSGPGIDSAISEKVFEPFYRGKGNQNLSGSGLGLPLVKKIIESHGGSVEIVNQPKSNVTVSLPIQG